MLLFLATIEDENFRSLMERICEEYLEDMVRAANSILHNEQDAQDAVQSAFVRLLDHGDLLQKLTNTQIKWYVVKSAFNAAKDKWRDRKRLGETSLSEDIAMPDLMEHYEIKDQVERMILKLSKKEQEFLVLRHVYELKYAEIGEMMNCSEEAARKTVKRAEAKLKKMYKEQT